MHQRARNSMRQTTSSKSQILRPLENTKSALLLEPVISKQQHLFPGSIFFMTASLSLSRPDRIYVAQPIPFTNLITLVILNSCDCDAVTKKQEPTPVNSQENECLFGNREKDRHRRRPESCINHHPEVSSFHSRFVIIFPKYPF